jgi:arylsulfatase A-like enzyme
MDKLKKVADWDHRATPYYRKHDKDCGAIIDGALEQLGDARKAGKRAFVSLLPIEPHVPYRYHDGVTDKYHSGEWEGPFGKHATARTLVKIRKMDLSAGQWSQVHALYAGEVEHADGCIGALLDGIAALGATGDTAVVVTSDHGEGMGERGGHATGHAYGLHGELIAVPLIVIGGGLEPATVDVVTSNADIAPTILDLLGVEVDARMQGQSLLPMARAGAPWPQRVVASEYGRSYGLRGGRWRMVVGYDGDATVHDVIADPEEGRDISAEQPMVRRWLSDAAGLYLAFRTRWHDATWGGLTDIAPTSPLAPGSMNP